MVWLATRGPASRGDGGLRSLAMWEPAMFEKWNCMDGIGPNLSDLAGSLAAIMSRSEGKTARRGQDGPQKSPLKPVQCPLRPLFKSLARRQRVGVAAGFYLDHSQGRHILFTLCCSGIGKQESCKGAVRQLGGESQRSTKEIALNRARNPGFLYRVYLHYYVSEKYHANLFDPRQSVTLVSGLLRHRPPTPCLLLKHSLCTMYTAVSR